MSVRQFLTLPTSTILHSNQQNWLRACLVQSLMCVFYMSRLYSPDVYLQNEPAPLYLLAAWFFAKRLASKWEVHGPVWYVCNYHAHVSKWLLIATGREVVAYHDVGPFPHATIRHSKCDLVLRSDARSHCQNCATYRLVYYWECQTILELLSKENTSCASKPARISEWTKCQQSY